MPTPQDRESARRAQQPVRYALALLICVIGALVAVGAVASYRIYKLGNHRFIDQAGPFFAVTEDLAVEMLNEETGVRGYVITADPKTLAPYYQGKKYVNVELALIAKDASFDPKIPAHLDAMRRQVAVLQGFFANEILLVKSGPAGQRRAQANVIAGKGHFDHLRLASRDLINDASSVIKRSHREQRGTLVTSFAVLGSAGFVAIAIAVGLLLVVPRRLFQLYREERIARRAAEQSADAARALAHVRESVVLLDEAGVVRYWNPSAGALFGLVEEAGESAALAHVLDEFHSAGESPGARPVTLDGRERWLTCAESPFDGGRVVVFRDVSDEQRLEQLRSDFVATAAHELRTPLAAVYGAVRTLRQAEYKLSRETSEQFLGMIENESERLRIVMDQLLVSAQLDRADLHLHRQPVDAVDLCEDVVGSVRVRKPEAIELTFVSHADVTVDADPDRLRQVIANLLDNAIKYSPGGGLVELRDLCDGRSGRDRGGRSRPRHPRARAAADLREVLPPRSEHDARDRRLRPRAVHQPRARAAHGRAAVGLLARRRGLDVHGDAAARRVGGRCERGLDPAAFISLSSPPGTVRHRRDSLAPTRKKVKSIMRRLMAVTALAVVVAASTVLSATAAPVTTNVVNLSVSNGSLHFDQKTVTAKAGLVRINFTNNSTAPHNVSLEHGGEFEFGASLTIHKGVATTFLTLAKGTYHLYSSVGTDEDKGMAATLIVK